MTDEFNKTRLHKIAESAGMSEHEFAGQVSYYFARLCYNVLQQKGSQDADGLFITFPLPECELDVEFTVIKREAESETETEH